MLSLGVVAVAALSLVSCQKENFKPNEPAVKGTPFSLTASIADTKTANDGLKTNWIDKDAINLFHAEAGSTTYSNDGQFTIADISTGKFDGTITGELTADTYDWYAFYPYTSQMSAPDGTKGWATLGHAARGSIAQNGNNSTLHLAGNALPLYGKATVAANEPVVLAMKNLASVVKVVVTNTTDEPLTVSSVKFTSTEDIVGTFYYNLTGADVVYKSSGANYTSSTASLTVENGETIAKGSSASFFIPVKPHTAATGATLKISVNGYEKPLTLPKDVEFIAGSINAIKFNYDDNSIQKECTINFNDANTVKALCASVPNSGKNVAVTKPLTTPEGFVLSTTDGTNTTRINNVSGTYEMRLYKGTNSNGSLTLTSPNGHVMTKIAFTYPTGKQAFDNWEGVSSSQTFNCTETLHTISTITITYQSDNAPKNPFIVASDIEVSARGAEMAELTYEVKNPVEGTSVSITCDGTIVTEAEDVDGTIIYSVAKNTTDAAREGKITITYGEVVKEVKVSQLAPVFKVSREVVELNATADASTTITVTSDFDWMASASGGAQFTFDPEIIVWDNSYTDGKTTVTITANAANESEDGTITLGEITFTNDIDKELIVTVKQKSSYVAPSTGTDVTFDWSANKITDTKTADWEMQQDGVTLKFSIANNTNKNYPSINKEGAVRLYQNNTLTILAPEGKSITKVEFTSTGDNYNATKLLYNGTALESDSWSPTSPINSAILTVVDISSTQCRFKKIVITYE